MRTFDYKKDPCQHSIGFLTSPPDLSLSLIYSLTHTQQYTMHHSRRKSGNTSMTEKTVTATDPSRYGKRPTTLSRRQTPVAAQKLGKSHRDREREWQDSWDDDRESFPQFWYVNMICLSLSLCFTSALPFFLLSLAQVAARAMF